MDIEKIQEKTTVPIIRGPKDIRDLPDLFDADSASIMPDLVQHSIDIIAEINHAPRMEMKTILATAREYIAAGADMIDLGCDPEQSWSGVGECVRRLVGEGIPVSIDSFDPVEVTSAVDAGASLVLSVNETNRERALDWGAEVVVIPGMNRDEKSFEETIFFLLEHDVRVRLDPILDPLGVGFTDSVARYRSTRHRFPELPMMMGIGNLTELTDVDSAGVNVLLMGICQELRIESVLTTQVINWARSSIKECDLARRMVHYSVSNQTPPKRVSDALVMLRDRKLKPYPGGAFESLAQALKDNNYRLFAQDQQ
ncbi:MAG: dihydropteroate synthase, partial [Planctomycetota bacterium]